MSELEKKAIDVIRNKSHKLIDNFTQEDLENREISIFLAGYHECQKEHEWHYVKDGDLPTEITEKEYLVALKSEYGGFFYETDIWCKSLHCFASNNPKNVYAWKEIVLPKENE